MVSNLVVEIAIYNFDLFHTALMMNSTLGSVVPLTMFLFLTRFFFCSLTCLFRVSQLAAGKTQSLRRGERGSRDGEVSEQTTLALLHIYPQPSR